MRLSLRRLYWLVALGVPLMLASSHLVFGADVPSISIIENTNTDVILLLSYVLLALGLSFLCSVAEAVLLSMTPSYIEAQKERLPKRAALLKRLKLDNVDRSLAAILTLNTIAHTVGAIMAGAKATVIFGSAWFGFFSAVMTLMILFLSEIVPKTLGAIYWSKLVGPTAIFILCLIVILYPLVWLSEKLTKFISHGKNIHIFSRAEFLAMARIGEQTGLLSDNESRIIFNLFRFKTLKVTDIMTPRTVVVGLPEDMTIMDAIQRISAYPFSRLPLFKNDIHDITGFVLRDDILLMEAQNHGDETLASMKRDIYAVPESSSLSKLLVYLLEHHQHIAIVVDEYGAMKGLVTLEDLFETLLGIEIMDETDEVEDMRVLARKLWIQRAKALGIDVEIAEQ
ncbi:MAG TPA: HlyC/CorC family transporter [Deltaproteobacteria bacterium]|nr:HlyC/CorC family transporter [Deltaproteobacteria bacterium]